MDIYKYDQTDSTNLRAKEAILSGASLPCLFVANSQTMGRGRMGKSFYSPKDTGLYMTLALPYNYIDSDNVSITSLSAVAVSLAIKEICDIDTGIKWVNDLYIENKKVCGILTELVYEPLNNTPLGIIIGIGINLSTKDFPSDIENSATSLFVNEDIKEKLYSKITENILSIKDNSFMDEYRRLSIVLGKEIRYTVNGVDFDGVALGINDMGHLKVLNNDGSNRVLSSGEISLKLMRD